MERHIPPWEYGHLRLWAGVRIAAGIILAVEGALVLSIGRYGWAAAVLVPAALLLWFGYVELSVARSAHPRSCVPGREAGVRRTRRRR